MALPAAAALVLAAWTVPAAAQEIAPVTLRPGEAVTIRFDEGGRVGEPERGQAEWTPFTVYAARRLAGETPPDAPQRFASPMGHDSDAPPAERPTPGQIRLRFLSIAGQHALLVVENGLDRALVYRARMTQDGNSRPTDVCLVMPGLPGFEHWPHPIDRIELSDFRFVPWVPGQPIPCA